MTAFHFSILPLHAKRSLLIPSDIKASLMSFAISMDNKNQG